MGGPEAASTQEISLYRSGIGGRDASAICGLNPRKTAVDVWLEKTQGVEQKVTAQQQNLFDWGHLHERLVAEEFAKRQRRLLVKAERQVVKFENMTLIGSPDAAVTSSYIDGFDGLEIKNTEIWCKDDWGPSGTDGAPWEHLLQCQHYLMVGALAGGYRILTDDAGTDVGIMPFSDVWHLAALIGKYDYREYTIQSDAELQDMMLGRYRQFYGYVQRNEMPPPGQHDDIGEYLLKKYPEDNGRIIRVSDYDRETIELVERLEKVRKIEGEAKKVKDEINTKLKAMMTDASTMLVDDYATINWKKSADKTVTDWENVAKALMERLGTGGAEAAQQIVQQSTSVEQGSRVFRVNFKKGKGDE
jgi:predicted phage-related endonuclease